jgi:hypothetical protein
MFLLNLPSKTKQLYLQDKLNQEIVMQKYCIYPKMCFKNLLSILMGTKLQLQPKIKDSKYNRL